MMRHDHVGSLQHRLARLNPSGAPEVGDLDLVPEIVYIGASYRDFMGIIQGLQKKDSLFHICGKKAAQKPL